jgi:hypothetical protein
MPLHKLNRTLRPQLLDLRAALEKEWRHPRSGKTAEPVIYESDPGSDEPIELYVVWSRWEDTNATDRTDVILDAYEAVRGKDAVMRVSVALGFTQPEAELFGLRKKAGGTK